ncbi:MAG: acyl-CoA thioesterase II [Actinomycetota bacterium]|nr:acyl-CoA thioesterase II [Actinomycetota bacterium]
MSAPVQPITGQPAVDGLVATLDLTEIEPDVYDGRSPAESLQRVFGGQVAGQALVAAGRTVPDDRPVHSLHAYFLRPGDPRVPIRYTVDRIRDGRSFTTRRVVAVQHDEAIFNLSASFQRGEPPVVEHSLLIPVVPDPEGLPTFDELIAPVAEQIGRWASLPRPIDRRHIGNPMLRRPVGNGEPAVTRVWMRADGVLPDDPLVHLCALTFASDMTLLDAALAREGMTWGLDPVVGASLDHAMWFHRPFRADEWFLYEADSPSASEGRALCSGRIWSRDGRHLVTVMQEGLVRRVRP